MHISYRLQGCIWLISLLRFSYPPGVFLPECSFFLIFFLVLLFPPLVFSAIYREGATQRYVGWSIGPSVLILPYMGMTLFPTFGS